MYDVSWTSSALQELAALWIDADTDLREAIAAACNEIDTVLAESPDEVGGSRPDQRRIAFMYPIGILFRIRPADQRVVVSHVWSFRRPTP